MRNLGEMVNLSTFYSTDMHISLLITESDVMHMHTQIVVIPHLFRRKAVHYHATLLHCCRGRGQHGTHAHAI